MVRWSGVHRNRHSLFSIHHSASEPVSIEKVNALNERDMTNGKPAMSGTETAAMSHLHCIGLHCHYLTLSLRNQSSVESLIAIFPCMRVDELYE